MKHKLPNPDPFRENVRNALEIAKLYVSVKGVDDWAAKSVKYYDIDKLFLQELDAAVNLYKDAGGKMPKQPGMIKHAS